MSTKFKLYDTVFILLLVYLFILQLQAIWPFTIDDMYISLRYANHWAMGDGLLWNVRLPAVEGYSNFSFVLLATAAILLKLNPVIVLKVTGIIGLLFTSISLYCLSRFWFTWRSALMPVIGLLLYKGQIIWTASGLETAVYEALLCASVYYIFKGMGYLFFPSERVGLKPYYLFLAGFFLAIAGMTRPEAPVFMLLFFALLACDIKSVNLKKFLQAIAAYTLPLILFYLPYFLWRWHYYGFLFPNPVYCKGLSTDYFLIDRTYLQLIWPFALLCIPALLKARDRRHLFLWLPSLAYLCMLWSSDPIVAFDNRLFLPAFVLLLPLSLQGLDIILKEYFHLQARMYTVCLLFTCLLLAIVFIPSMTLAEYRYFSENPQKGEQLRAEVIDWLNVNAKPEDFVVLADSGLIPYRSHANFIDSYCLNNKAMGHYPKEQRYEYFCQQVIRAKPRIIILTSLTKKGEVIYTPSDVCLKKLLTHHSGYKLNKTFSTKHPETNYSYELFTNF